MRRRADRAGQRARPDPYSAHRWGALLSGGSVVFYGLTRRTAAGRVLALAGAALAARGLIPGRPPGRSTGPGHQATSVGGERMSDEQRGLGKVVYSNEADEVREQRKDTSDATDAIKEASKESFPASDPPGYAAGAGKDVSIAPDSQAAAGDHPPHTEAVKEMTEHDQRRSGST